MKRFYLLLLPVLLTLSLTAQDFPIVSANNGPAPIYVDPHDHWLVRHSAELLRADIERVTGKRPVILNAWPDNTHNLIIIGSMDSSATIRRIMREHKLSTAQAGKWEAYTLQTLTAHSTDILLITGSDRRGTAYGVLELSRQIGVSPWYYWADVPIPHKDELFFKQPRLTSNGPAVKYRGFFINDEAPALSGWVRQKFGNFNHEFYEHVFELLLRLKANYLWPAMWGNAFNADDTLNPILASKYGIVMGTSHHEPMLRAQQEWKRYGSGPWDYSANAKTLDSFWTTGIRHMDHHESIVTVGMRGDGDMPMQEGANIALLQKIVSDQRAILQKVTGKNPAAIPQSWALYKEVQEYYDKGMRVPDDITLLLCDDNWGNIRKLPMLGEKPRAGGYGLYYHFDYVGGPRNYKWINTNQISRAWEQLHLAKAYGVDRIWIVNVGDIKPLEFPTQFFLDYAWDPDAFPAEKLPAYTLQWATTQFGPEHAPAIADILNSYTRYNARRKPELLSADTYSLPEWQTVVSDYRQLADKATTISKQLPAGYQDAYFELILYPVLASANLNELYYTVAKNHLYAAQGNPQANDLATIARELFAKDSILSLTYNRDIANGKWPHMMDQTHIGYTYWQQPDHNAMPAVDTVVASAVDTTQTAAIPRQHANPPASFDGYIETNGCVSIEAEHFTQAITAKNIHWQVIPGLGRTLSGVEAMPVTAPAISPDQQGPRLEYSVYLSDTGTVRVQAYFAPILEFNRKTIHYAIGFDDETPQLIDASTGNETPGKWDKMVADNICIRTSTHHVAQPGPHILKFYTVDPGIVLEKIVIDAGGVKPFYLGPPESPRQSKGLASAYRDYFPIGVAVSPRSISGPDSTLIIQQFNSLTPENAMKMGPIHPSENQYNFKDADAIVDFAQRHDMRVRGHNLCWHEQTPAWLFKDAQNHEVTKAVLLQRLKDHITTVVRRYKGKVYAWDVVNEAIADDSAQLLRSSPWLRICGDEFIAKAFEYAHEADPDAQLFYNDYNTERPEKRARVYRLLKQLKDAGVPITGVGLQGHWSIYEPSADDLQKTIEQFASLGLKVQITELDISIYPWEKNRRSRRPDESDAYTPELEQGQTAQYKMAFSIFRTNAAHSTAGPITGVTFWNVTDRHTWLDDYPVPGRKNYPLLFDVEGRPKQAWNAVTNF